MTRVNRFFLAVVVALCLQVPHAYSQNVAFQAAFSYDQYRIPYLDLGYIGSEGYASRAFMTKMGISLGIQISTESGFLIRPRADFGSTMLLRYGFFRRNQVKEELIGKQAGSRMEFMLDFGMQEEALNGKLMISGLMGFGIGIDDGDLNRYDIAENYSYLGLGLIMQSIVSLTYVVTPNLRVGLEQRHEFSLFQYGQESSGSYDSHGWTVYSAGRTLNYIPPLLRAELLLGNKQKR